MKICCRWYTGRSVYFLMDIGSMLNVEVGILRIMYYILCIRAVLHLLASMGGGAVVAGSWGDELGKVWVFQVGLEGDSGGRHIYEHGCWVLVPRLRQDII